MKSLEELVEIFKTSDCCHCRKPFKGGGEFFPALIIDEKHKIVKDIKIACKECVTAKKGQSNVIHKITDMNDSININNVHRLLEK